MKNMHKSLISTTLLIAIMTMSMIFSGVKAETSTGGMYWAIDVGNQYIWDTDKDIGGSPSANPERYSITIINTTSPMGTSMSSIYGDYEIYAGTWAPVQDDMDLAYATRSPTDTAYPSMSSGIYFVFIPLTGTGGTADMTFADDTITDFFGTMLGMGDPDVVWNVNGYTLDYEWSSGDYFYAEYNSSGIAQYIDYDLSNAFAMTYQVEATIQIPSDPLDWGISTSEEYIYDFDSDLPGDVEESSWRFTIGTADDTGVIGLWEEDDMGAWVEVWDDAVFTEITKNPNATDTGDTNLYFPFTPLTGPAGVTDMFLANHTIYEWFSASAFGTPTTSQTNGYSLRFTFPGGDYFNVTWDADGIAQYEAYDFSDFATQTATFVAVLRYVPPPPPVDWGTSAGEVYIYDFTEDMMGSGPVSSAYQFSVVTADDYQVSGLWEAGDIGSWTTVDADALFAAAVGDPTNETQTGDPEFWFPFTPLTGPGGDVDMFFANQSIYNLFGTMMGSPTTSAINGYSLNYTWATTDYFGVTYNSSGVAQYEDYDFSIMVAQTYMFLGAIRYMGPIDHTPVASFTVDHQSGVHPLTVQFTDTSTSADGISAWLWDFDEGNSSALQNPTNTFYPGTYDVNLTVWDDDGDWDDYILQITVYSDTVPEADFGAVPTSGMEPLTVDFTDMSTSDPGNDIVTWLWDFDDGTPTSSLQDPSHEFANDGTYDVNLTVWDADGDWDYDIMQITVDPFDFTPTASFTVDHQSGVHPLTVQFTDTSVSGDGISAWLWDFDEGNSSALQNPSNTFYPGTYDVNLTVWDNDGDWDDYILQITVYSDTVPEADFTAVPYSGLAPLTVDFTDLSTFDLGNDIVTWLWDFDDGFTSPNEDPSHEFTNAGIYDVNLTVWDADGDWDYIVLQITAIEDTTPVAVIGADDTDGVAPHTVHFTDDTVDFGNGFDHRLWDFDDGSPTSTDANPTHIFAVGTYSVTLTVWDTDGDYDTDTIVIHVYPDANPVANFTVDVSQGTSPLTVTFTELSTFTTGNDIVAWHWDFGDGNTSTLENPPSHDFWGENIFTVNLTVWDADGDNNTKLVPIQVVLPGDNIPDASFTLDPMTGQEPLLVQFNDTTTSLDGISAWLWDFGDGSPTSSVQNATHTFNAGTYTVNLTVWDGDGVNPDWDSHTYVITIDPNNLPIASFTADKTYGNAPLAVQFTSTSFSADGIASFLWDFGDGTTNTVNINPSHTFDVGVFTVNLTIWDNDGDSDNYTMTITAKEVELQASFSISGASGAAPFTVTFTDTSTPKPGKDIVSWMWDFGDGGSSVEQNVTHTFLKEGTYTVTLTVRDKAGNTSKCNATITVSAPTPGDGDGDDLDVPGFPLGPMMMVFGIIALVLVFKKRKSSEIHLANR